MKNNQGLSPTQLNQDTSHFEPHKDCSVAPYLPIAASCKGSTAAGSPFPSAPPSAGKGQPLDSNVPTIYGWKRMVDLSMGEKLASIDGKPSEVTGIANHGTHRLFEFAFSDGRTCRAADMHLWEVMYRDWGYPRVKTTSQLVAMLGKLRYRNRLSVRLFSGEFGNPVASEFGRWLLGVLLGDGCFRASVPMLSAADQPLVTRVTRELRMIGCDLRPGSVYDYRIVDPRMNGNRVREWITSLGLWGKLLQHKVIPSFYVSADKQSRIELLKGLMDTDGTACKEGGAEYSSSSLELATQVRDLVRSLGGKANLRSRTTTHLDHYRVSVILKDRSQIFYLPRKLERVSSPRNTHIYNRLTLRSISETAPGACRSISLSHRDNLYITDNYVVTHGILS